MPYALRSQGLRPRPKAYAIGTKAKVPVTRRPKGIPWHYIVQQKALSLRP